MDIDDEQMNDEEFLARQMYLAGLQDPLLNVNVRVNHGADNPDQNQVVMPGNQSDQAGNQQGDQTGNQQGHHAGNQQGNQAGDQQTDQASNQQGDQAGNQQGDQAGNHRGDQARHQVCSRVGNLPAHQAGNLPGYPLVNLNANQIRKQPFDYFGIGNLALPQQYSGRGVLQGYPQGYGGLDNQRVNVNNVRYQVGQRRQRRQYQLSLADNAQANRLMGIINNLESELQRSRQVYQTLYGPILRNENHDAGYWKRLYFQEKSKNSRNQGKNLYFFNK